MQKALPVIFVVSVGLLLAGCNKDEAAANSGPSAPISSAPAKGGDTQALVGEMLPGPGAAEAESRVGSKLKDNR
jgi:nitrous oxide reductase accessory protein NosL